MKTLFITSFLALGFITMANAKVIIEESYYVETSDKNLMRTVGSQPDLAIDHPTRHGFEVHGPKGLGVWLTQLKLTHRALEHSHGFGRKGVAGYPSYKQWTTELKAVVDRFPQNARLFSLGKTVQGRDIWAVKISANVANDLALPEFKYISTMHGDEITGRELSRFLVKDLLEGYGKDPYITKLINSTEIFIVPNMNPDGSEMQQRGNAHNVDLNRSFPDIGIKSFRSASFKTAGLEPEVAAIMRWHKERHFALSANYHGGAEVVNYPWDSRREDAPLTPLVKAFSIEYAATVDGMYNSREFPLGVTNGYAWYEVKGGMQDYSYYYFNDLQVTIEVSEDKWPDYSMIIPYYKKNRSSMIKYIARVHQGAGFAYHDRKISGKVTVRALNRMVRMPETYPFKEGEFYKVLPPGNYEFEVFPANGVAREVFQMQVSENRDLVPRVKILGSAKTENRSKW